MLQHAGFLANACIPASSNPAKLGDHQLEQDFAALPMA